MDAQSLGSQRRDGRDGMDAQSLGSQRRDGRDGRDGMDAQSLGSQRRDGRDGMDAQSLGSQRREIQSVRSNQRYGIDESAESIRSRSKQGHAIAPGASTVNSDDSKYMRRMDGGEGILVLIATIM
jgi:hypothetical protein